jgi:hypothetical protein
MSLETLALIAWRAWADDQRHGLCSRCGRIKSVGRARGSRRWLCLECWDSQ